MPADATLRGYQPGDGAALREIFLAAVRETGRRFYDDAQVGAWAGRARSPDLYDAKAGDGRRVLVALDGENRPVAYGELEADGHIDHVYCHPDASGRGVASALYDALETLAREQGVTRLYVEASEAARPLFTRKGFEVIARNNLEIDGVPIHNWRMEKRLSP